MDQGAVTVVHLRDAAFALGIRDHELTLDQPVDAAGTDAGPTPTELFVGAIAGCVAHYAAAYLRRHHLISTLKVTGTYTMGSAPTRVRDLSIRIHAPGVPESEQAKLLTVAQHCTLHNTLQAGLNLDIEMAAQPSDGFEAPRAS